MVPAAGEGGYAGKLEGLAARKRLGVAEVGVAGEPEELELRERAERETDHVEAELPVSHRGSFPVHHFDEDRAGLRVDPAAERSRIQDEVAGEESPEHLLHRLQAEDRQQHLALLRGVEKVFLEDLLPLEAHFASPDRNGRPFPEVLRPAVQGEEASGGVGLGPFPDRPVELDEFPGRGDQPRWQNALGGSGHVRQISQEDRAVEPLDQPQTGAEILASLLRRLLSVGEPEEPVQADDQGGATRLQFPDRLLTTGQGVPEELRVRGVQEPMFRDQ